MVDNKFDEDVHVDGEVQSDFRRNIVRVSRFVSLKFQHLLGRPTIIKQKR